MKSSKTMPEQFETSLSTFEKLENIKM